MTQPQSVFVERGVTPLLTDLLEPLRISQVGPEHPACACLRDFTRTVFQTSYGARLPGFFPELLQFTLGERTQAVVGYRPAVGTPLFLEQYLDRSAEDLAGEILYDNQYSTTGCQRTEMVEVGNLAILDPGLARWIIAATTAFLHAAGWRWVLFTATRPLANAFRRLGLRPLALANADPRRLPDGGTDWGSYYNGRPQVYLGDIRAGAQKLLGDGPQRSHLQALLAEAGDLGRRRCPTVIPCQEGGR